jgi:general L-amino acid transport system substrate-binding protein
MRKLSFLLLLVLALLSLSVAAVTAQEGDGAIVQRILSRGDGGELVCGVHPGLRGFGLPNDAGEYEGFDVDICRAIAAAILGDASKISYLPVEANNRPTVLASGEVDLLSRNTTYTLTRDTDWGVIFGPTTFYDGQGVMVRSDSGITDLAGLDGGTICVQTGTTTELNISDAESAAGVDWELAVFDTQDATVQAYIDGLCDGYTTDISGLLSTKVTQPDPGAHVILEEVLSKEPLGPLSPQSDEQLSEIIRWTVYGLITAEEEGLTSENVDTFLRTDDEKIAEGDTDEQKTAKNTAYTERVGAGVARLVDSELGLGGTLGIANDFMYNVIKQVGNYGEIFDRNLGPETVFGLERGVNALWTEGGLMYAPPFR